MMETFKGDSFELILKLLERGVSPRDLAQRYGYESVNKCLQDLLCFAYNCAWIEAEEDFARRVIY